MRFIPIVILALSIQACSTLGRTIQGAGEDIKRGTDYLSGVILPDQRR